MKDKMKDTEGVRATTAKFRAVFLKHGIVEAEHSL